MNLQKGYQGYDIFRDFIINAYLKICGRKLQTLLTLYKEGHCSLGYKLLNHDTSKSSCMKEEKECISTWILWWHITSGNWSRDAMERTHGMIMSKGYHFCIILCPWSQCQCICWTGCAIYVLNSIDQLKYNPDTCWGIVQNRHVPLIKTTLVLTPTTKSWRSYDSK